MNFDKDDEQQAPVQDHVPDPTAMSGTLETTGVGGGHHSRLEGVVGVFKHMLHHTVERHGVAEHNGPIVQGDTTGIPASTAPAASEGAPESETAGEKPGPEDAVVTNDGAPSEVTESKEASADESDKSDDEQNAKTPAGRRTAKKTASTPDAAKK